MARPDRPGSPEGTRAHIRARRTTLAALVILSMSFALAFGDGRGTVTVTNLTPHIVSIVVADRSYPVVLSGDQVSYASSVPATVGVKVSYASGQGVAGTAERSFHLISGPPGTGGATMFFACRVGDSVTSPAGGAVIVWKVTADTLAAGAP